MGYSSEVVQAVQLLTKNKDLSYEDNIKSIIDSGNRLAMMVKYADNYQNFTGDKSTWSPDKAADSQKKYLASLNMLGDKLGIHKHINNEPTITTASTSAANTQNDQLDEKIPKGADVDYYISDFAKSNAPQFKNKTAEKKKRMAIAAYYASKQK